MGAFLFIFVRPLTTAGIISGIESVCQGMADTLTESVPGGTWLSADNTVASIATDGIVHGVHAGSDSIFYSVTDACGSAITGINMNVDTVLIPTITGSVLACTTGSQYLDTLIPTPDLGMWSTSVLADSVSTTGVFYGNVSGVVTVTYSVTNACGTSVTTINIDVLTLPIAASILGSTYNICVGSNQTYTDLTADGVWNVSDTNASLASTSGNAVITGVVAGSEVLSYSVSNTCGTTTITQTLTINALPVPVITPEVDSIHLYTSAGDLNYQWYSSNGTTLIPGATDSTYSASENGSYSVYVTDSAGCSAMSAVFWVTKLAVADVSGMGNNISVFPNPTNGVLYFKSTSNINAAISSMDGRIIQRSTNTTEMDLSVLPNGIYIVTITDPTSGIALKVVRVEKMSK